MNNDPEYLMQVFGTAFYICLGIMILGFLLAFFFFFYYRIPQVFALITGRVQKKTVEKMMQSGVLRSQKDIEEERSNSAKLAYMNVSSEELSTQNISYHAEELVPSLDDAQQSDTTLLEPAQETALLQQETTVLSQDKNSTGHENIMAKDDIAVADEDTDNGGQTMILGQKQSDIPPVRFEIKEHIMVIHTDDVI